MSKEFQYRVVAKETIGLLNLWHNLFRYSEMYVFAADSIISGKQYITDMHLSHVQLFVSKLGLD